MNVFMLVAAGMVAVHVVAALQRPRLAVIVSGILWALYAYYERQIATGVLCDANCNIRVDLVFLFPILWLATYCAWQSFMGRPGQAKIIGLVLGAIGLLVFALWAEGHGYGAVSNVVMLGGLVIGLYAIWSRLRSKTRFRSKPETHTDPV